MKVSPIFSISFFSGAIFIAGGQLGAQETGSYTYTSAEPGLYRSVETPIEIKAQSTLRKGIEITESQDYPPFREEVREEPRAAIKEVIPPPPIPREAPKPVKTSPPIVSRPATVIPPTPVVKAPVAPVKAPVAQIKAPVPPVKAPVAQIKAPVPPVTPKVEVAKVDRPAQPKVQNEVPFNNTYSRPVAPAVISSPVASSAPVQIGRVSPPLPPVAVATPVSPVSAFPSAPGQGGFPADPQLYHARPVFPESPAVVHNQDCPLHPLNGNGPDLTVLRNASNQIAQQGIEFRFGRSHPAFGGLDSSGAVQYLLNEIGVAGVPRTTGGQSSWIRVNSLLREFPGRPTVSELAQSMAPGNLIFWGDPFTGRLTHVMIYLGYDTNRAQHLAFGTRGGTEFGINGNEVDIFDLKLDRERIVSVGQIPGLRYQ